MKDLELGSSVHQDKERPSFFAWPIRLGALCILVAWFLPAIPSCNRVDSHLHYVVNGRPFEVVLALGVGLLPALTILLWSFFRRCRLFQALLAFFGPIAAFSLFGGSLQWLAKPELSEHDPPRSFFVVCGLAPVLWVALWIYMTPRPDRTRSFIGHTDVWAGAVAMAIIAWYLGWAWPDVYSGQICAWIGSGLVLVGCIGRMHTRC